MIPSRKRKIILSVALLLVSLAGYSQNPRVLIYTKNGEGFVHDNIPASIKGITKICQENGIAVDASDDPGVFTWENIEKYSALIFSNTNNETFDTDEQRLVFAQYIQAGGGFVGIHSASGSERDWPWFWACLGGKFRRHPQHQDFKIKVIDRDHLATKHLADVWNWPNGEFYYLDHLNPDNKILIAGDLRKLEDPENDGYPGVVFGDYFPMAWYHEYDGGRQFYTSLGHYDSSYEDADFLRLLLGGIKYAIGKDQGLNWDNAYMDKIARVSTLKDQ